MRKGEVGVLDTKSLCAKGGYWIRKACAQRGEGGTGYEKLVRKGGRGVLDTKSLCAKGGRGVLDTKSLCVKGGGGFWIGKACAQRGEGGSGYDKIVRKPYLEGFLLFFINRINSSQRRHKLHS